MDETTDPTQFSPLEPRADGAIGPTSQGDPSAREDETADRAATKSGRGFGSGSPSPTMQGDPTTIGRYRVIRRLGQGGFGRVYLARDDELDRAVAIKVPNPERVAGPGDVEEYLSEARTLARLDHPHIVPVYDVGRTDDGLCYVVSKYVTGSDLADRMRQGRLSFAESAGLVAVVAEALHHAHTRDLVHRDIKPANILLDAQGKPCVADFGLALRDEDYGKGARVTGTPAYMSPEQARGEGHRVDGRSDVFSLGVVFYELLTGRRPFRGDSTTDVLEQVVTAEPRPPRQVDDTIPKELERIALKALSKRAMERYTTAKDLAEDLDHFLQGDAASGSPAPTPGLVSPPSGSTPEATSIPPTPGRSDSDGRPVRVVPKGLRSFDRNDADFFLELLPGPRDRDGLPESIRFWKARIEPTDPYDTFKVGLIYGPSGCGKSSLVKAGLLPRLDRNVLPVYIEATPEETEARLLRGLHKACHDLPADRTLVDALAALRRERVLRSGRKVLLVVDQFEQWLFARRGEENTELVAALRQCDGEHVLAVVMVRDDFWMAATRFMRDLEIDLVPDQNIAVVDLFDTRHARKVLKAFGRAYRALPERTSDLSRDQESFLDQAITGLAQEGRVISVRLALFAEMVKGKAWSPATLREVGGTEGVGATFLEETFSSPQANPKHRLHQKAAQAVLKALLPQSGTDIKGQMRLEAELRDASGYAEQPRDFDDLIRILDPELRLITPTDPEDTFGEAQSARPGGARYYQLTHDYLVHSLRDWLTRKQRETRRGRADLRLTERAALWDAKPENRHLPTVLEWANIRLLTRPKDWTEPQRRMMSRAGRLHGLRALGLAAAAAVLVSMGWNVRHRIVEANQATVASGLVQQLLKADTAQIPAVVRAIGNYRRWTDLELKRAVAESSDPKEKLHASLALLPVDSTQITYLETRLLAAEPSELSVLRDELRPHSASLTPKLWSVLDAATRDDPRVLPAAGALALYDPADPRWADLGDKVAEALVTVNSRVLGPWLEALRPVRGKLTARLATIFWGKQQSETVHSLATDILADYARDDPGLLAELLMNSDPKAYQTLFPVAQRQAERTLPVFQAELAKKADPAWDDPPIDPSWTKPGPALVGCIESAQGILDDRFTFCQTMPLDEFRQVAEGLRKSGYRPVRFRPYADGQAVKVAAVWARDELNWRIGSGLGPELVRQEDEQNRSEQFLPVDVAGYVTTEEGGKPSDRYAAVWVAKSGDDDARMYVGTTAHEDEVQDELKQAKLISRTLHATIGSDGRTRYCGVWGRSPAASTTGHTYRDQFEGNFEQNQAKMSDRSLIDVAVSGASKPQTTRNRVQATLQNADKKLKTKPDDLNSRLARAVANLRLGENQQALHDLQVVVRKNPKVVSAKQYRVVALARLGKKRDAQSELEKFQKGDAPEHSKLYLAAVLAAELGEGADKAFETLEAAIHKQPKNADLRYDAARAFSLASKAISSSDKAKGRQLAERCLQLLREAVENNDADYGKMDEDADLDPIRDDPAFAEIMKVGHSDRRHAAVWTSDASFEAIPIYGLDPVAQKKKCRELMAQGYRPVSWSVTRTTPEGPLVTASVWHRPVVSEDFKDRLAERQARAAIALVRMGKAEEVWPLLRHIPDPRLSSFVINWLNPLGADPKLIAAALDRIDPNAKPTPAQGQQKMDAILFHPETSKRRALILALGTYGRGGLSPGEREPLAGKLLDFYRNDPDAGIHGAVEWTLRQWKQDEKLRNLDAELSKLKGRGNRRWYVNSQGQSFAVIEGPVEFSMGSPPSETDRFGEEIPHRRSIPRRFALATKEVTVEQYQEFVKENPEDDHPENDRYSPDLKGPMNNVSWYHAAAYCNWLSRKENLPECYEPNERGQYAEGMKILADALQRTGYRLPTEAEWEYGCRAGAGTSRYYGSNVDLLERYGWYMPVSRGRAWPCGSLLPNNLGLFDMLGNLYEWCLDPDLPYRKGGTSMANDNINEIEYINIIEKPRLPRGGTFSNLSEYLRSAFRGRIVPSGRLSFASFRLARTDN